MQVQVFGVFDNQHWAVTVVNEVVADRAQQSAPYSPLSPRAHHHQLGVLTLFDNTLTWSGSCHTLHLASYLHTTSVHMQGSQQIVQHIAGTSRLVRTECNYTHTHRNYHKH